jgi:hypothetical protein
LTSSNQQQAQKIKQRGFVPHTCGPLPYTLQGIIFKAKKKNYENSNIFLPCKKYNLPKNSSKTKPKNPSRYY